MNVPPWAGFVADFPDDQVESAGDIEVFGGRNVALALGEIFKSLGCRRISDPWSAGEVGWEFDFQYGDRGNFWCRVQSFHPVFWLLFEDRSLGDGLAYVELWRKFGNALERDPRFHKILWRPFKAGPPDWDEVEAASDPPERTFGDEFPPSKVEAKASRPSIWPYVIGVWLMLSGAATPFIPRHPDLFHKIGYSISGALIFLVGAFFLIAITQGRDNLLGPSRSPKGKEERSPGLDELRVADDIPDRRFRGKRPLPPAKPKPKAAGGSLTPAIVVAWCALTLIVVNIIDATIHGPRSQSEATGMAIVVLIVGLVMALRFADRRSATDRSPKNSAP